MKILIAILLSYLLGSISFAYLLGRLKGIDMKSQGSGNLGAKNALQVMGKKEALVVLIGDVGKGSLVVYLSSLIDQNELVIYLSAIAVVTGHIFSIFLNFTGGKGLATVAGTLLVISPLILIIEISIGLSAVFLTKKNIYLSAIIMIVFFPLAVYAVKGYGIAFFFGIVLMILTLFSHRKHIVEIFSGSK